MRLTTLLAFSGLSFSYAALTACKGDEGDEADTDTDTDTDADTDSDADTDTGETGEPGLRGFIGYPGEGTQVAGAYTGTESAGIYQFNDQAGTDFFGRTALCEFTWDGIDAASDPTPGTANPIPDFTANPCPGCEFGITITFHGGTETGPAGGCAGSFDATFSDGYSYGYGYIADYIDEGGTSFGPALMVAIDEASAWGSPGPATYDAASGAFEYVWVDQVGYL